MKKYIIYGNNILVKEEAIKKAKEGIQELKKYIESFTEPQINNIEISKIVEQIKQYNNVIEEIEALKEIPLKNIEGKIFYRIGFTFFHITENGIIIYYRNENGKYCNSLKTFEELEEISKDYKNVNVLHKPKIILLYQQLFKKSNYGFTPSLTFNTVKEFEKHLRAYYS